MRKQLFLNTAEVAEVIGITREQALNMVHDRRLPAVRIGGRGHWRIPVSAIRALQREASLNDDGRAGTRPAVTTSVDRGDGDVPA